MERKTTVETPAEACYPNAMNHDHAYKLLFSEPEMIADLLRGFVHQPWVDELDLSTLEPVASSYVSDDLRGREDDVVWRVKHKRRWIYVYLLIEFQSTIDPFMAVRLLTYIGLLYQDLIKRKPGGNDKRLPPVFPIVLYNGESRWQAATELKDLIVNMPGGLSDYVPSLKYYLLDEGAYRQEDLAPLKNLVAAIFRLENSRTPADMLAVIDNLVEWLAMPEQARLKRSFNVWINRVLRPMGADFPPSSDLIEMRAMLTQRIEQWAKEWQRQGKAEGKAEGRLEGRLEGRAEAKAQTLLKLLTLKFGPLPDWAERNVSTAGADQLDAWIERVLTANDLNGFFE